MGAPVYIEHRPDVERLLSHNVLLNLQATKSMQPIYILQPISSTAAALAEIQLPIAGQIKIGREAGNDFSFPNDTKMSSVHFEVIAEAGCCRVRDQGSSNGLFLNTKRISAALLVEGDELQAGDSRWRVVVRGGQPAQSTEIPYTAVTPLGQSRGFDPPPVVVAPPQPSLAQPDTALTDLQLASDRGVVRVTKRSERLTIGRTALANWVFEHDGQMSSLHLELFCEASGWRVKDLGSSNGTFLNESRVNEAQLRTGDEIRAGQSRFVVVLRPIEQPLPSVSARAVQFAPATGPLKREMESELFSPAMAILRRVSDGREFELPVGTTVQLGRGRGLPISLPDDLEVSTQHATIVFDGQVVQLQDTGSSNGTYVGAQRVANCQLKDGQRFRVGQTVMLVCLPRPESSRGQSRPNVAEPQPTEVAPLDSQPNRCHASSATGRTSRLRFSAEFDLQRTSRCSHNTGAALQ
jgi:pSer/pThr/pTyr-binding forkhead associated (FHA) protein